LKESIGVGTNIYEHMYGSESMRYALSNSILTLDTTSVRKLRTILIYETIIEFSNEITTSDSRWLIVL